MADDARDQQHKLFALIKGINIAMMTTRGADGKLRSRPMAVSDVTEDGHLYFLTGDASGKVHDLEADKEVVVTFEDTGKSSYVAVRGEGTISQDRAAIEAHWSEPARAWFPKGVDDPNIALIAVKIDEAEYWDSPSGTMVLVVGYTRAMLTGKPAEHIGDHAKLSL